MIEYETLKAQPRKFLAQTSLTVAEFEDLLPAFEKAYLKKISYQKDKGWKCKKKESRRRSQEFTGSNRAEIAVRLSLSEVLSIAIDHGRIVRHGTITS